MVNKRVREPSEARRHRARVERAAAVGILGGNIIGLSLGAFLWPEPYAFRQNDGLVAAIVVGVGLCLGIGTFRFWR